MKAYKKTVTLGSTGKITLADLPFKAGDRLDIIVIAEEKKMDSARKLRSLFRETRKIPKIKDITEEEIYAEINNHRTGR